MANVGGMHTYYSMISIWRTNDYCHAMIEKNADVVYPISQADMLRVKKHSASSVGWLISRISRTGRQVARALRIYIIKYLACFSKK